MEMAKILENRVLPKNNKSSKPACEPAYKAHSLGKPLLPRSCGSKPQLWLSPVTPFLSE